jgi:hypothetical protein
VPKLCSLEKWLVSFEGIGRLIVLRHYHPQFGHQSHHWADFKFADPQGNSLSYLRAHFLTCAASPLSPNFISHS